MKNPGFISPNNDEVDPVAEVFSTPLVVEGMTWIPLTQLIVWPVMAWVAKKRLPDRSWRRSLEIGVMTMPVVLGSEWGHNLAHAAAARLVGKPMDAMRVYFGMPRVIYNDINDQSVTPRQHILRALVGPVFNLLLLPFALIFRRFTRPDSAARDVADAAVAANALIPAAGLLPIPGLDGGPILKWSLVEKGFTIPQADLAVRKVNGVLGALLGFGGALALKKRRWVPGGLLVLLGAAALGVATGLVKEQD
jgi:Zn-dependent protease